MMFFEPSERIPIFGDESYAHGVPNPFLCRVSPLWDCNWYSKDLDNPQFDQDLMLGFHQSYYIMNHDWKHTENVHISTWTYGFCSFSSLVSNVHPVIRTSGHVLSKDCFDRHSSYLLQYLYLKLILYCRMHIMRQTDITNNDWNSNQRDIPEVLILI